MFRGVTGVLPISVKVGTVTPVFGPPALGTYQVLTERTSFPGFESPYAGGIFVG